MPEQASLFRSGVPLDSPLEGHSLWDLALITPGSELALSQPGVVYFIFILLYFILFTLCTQCPFPGCSC